MNPIKLLTQIRNIRKGHCMPLKVSHHLNYRCNLQCEFCGRFPERESLMPKEQVKALMTFFRQLGTIYWSFNGGEPLLHPHFKEFAEFGKQIGFNTSLITNGILIPHNIDAVALVNRVVVSLEGMRETNDKIRGDGAFESAVEGIKIAGSKKIPVTIATVINKINLGDFEQLVDFASSIGCTVTFQPIHIHTEESRERTAKLFPTSEDISKACEVIKALKRKYKNILCTDSYLNMVAKYWPKRPSIRPCYAGKAYCNITPDGRIAPCCAKLFDNDLLIETQSGDFTKPVSNIPDMSACSDCLYNDAMEINMLISLKPKVIFEMAGFYFENK